MFIKYLRLLRDARGGVLIIVALSVIPIMLILGLSIDTAMGINAQKKLQSAVTAAAMGGAASNSTQLSTISAQAQDVFTARTAGMSGVSTPIITYDSTANTVTVSATVTISNIFMKVGGINTSTYGATYTENNTSQSGLYILAPSLKGSLDISNSGILNVPSMTIKINSSDCEALNISGRGVLTATKVNIVGGYTNRGTITTTQGVVTVAIASQNPYSSLTAPSYSACNYTNFSSTATQTLSPGVYCNGLRARSGANLALNPGQYIIDGGSFEADGGKIIGNNVTIILTKKLTGSYAKLSLRDGKASKITLSAPTSGTFSGVALYQDSNAPTNTDNRLSDGLLSISGALVFPSTEIRISGGGAIKLSNSSFIVDSLTISNSGSLSSN